MSFSRKTFSRISSAAVLIALAIGSTVSAQTNNVDALYQANSERPLGGLFAKGFTRTFTLMGGGNFSAADLPGIETISPSVVSPGSFSLIDQDSNDVGYVISGAMGRRHSHRLRSEIEFAIRGPIDIESQVNAYSLMKNVFFDLPNQTRFTPYAGAGIGISLVEVEALTPPPSTTFFSPTNPPAISEVSEEETVLSYQFIGGVSTRVNRAMDFVVEYRFFGTSDVELDTLGTAPYLVNNLFMGVKLEY